MFLRSDFNCACLSSEHSFWQCRGHLYPPVTFNAFETSMYLPAVLNNNGDKLKKKKKERVCVCVCVCVCVYVYVHECVHTETHRRALSIEFEYLKH